MEQEGVKNGNALTASFANNSLENQVGSCCCCRSHRPPGPVVGAVTPSNSKSLPFPSKKLQLLLSCLILITSPAVATFQICFQCKEARFDVCHKEIQIQDIYYSTALNGEAELLRVINAFLQFQNKDFCNGKMEDGTMNSWHKTMLTNTTMSIYMQRMFNLSLFP